MHAIVVGETEPAGALAGALLEAGEQADLVAIHHPPEVRPTQVLADALVDLEGRIAAERPDVAIAVAIGDAALALALVAAKAGVPLLTCQRDQAATAAAALDEEERLRLAERRILDELAEATLELPGEQVGADVVAERVCEWAARRSGR